MKCEDYQEQISPYLDDALSRDEKLQLEAHLKTCPTCEETLSMMRLMIEGLSELEEQALPQGFHEALHERLLEEQVPIQMPKKTNRRIPQWFPYVSGIAAAVLVAFIVLPQAMNNINKQEVEATVAPPPPAAMPQVANTRMQADPYSLEPAAEEAVADRSKEKSGAVTPEVQIINDAPQVQMINDLPAEVRSTEEEWVITSYDHLDLASFIKAYCETQEIDFTTWEENEVTHYVLNLVSKEDFKTKLIEQIGSEEALAVTEVEDTNRIHLLVK